MDLDGKKIKLQMLADLKAKVSHMTDKPHLVVIQVGNDSGSDIYVREKQKMAEYVGYKFTHLHYKESVTQEELIKTIDELNDNQDIHGILVQLPLPKNLNENIIINTIKDSKDVDGLTDINAGKLLHHEPGLYPCTPSGIMTLLKAYDINVNKKNVVIIGRSNIVGKPLSIMMKEAGANVTICHSKTDNLKQYTKVADILAVAVGKPNLITTDMVKENVVVIDVGINYLNNKICGDVDYKQVKNKAAYITPVPGGIGPMTIAILAENLLKAYNFQK